MIGPIAVVLLGRPDQTIQADVVWCCCRSFEIKAAEASMIAELRDRAASLAIATASEIITTKLDDKASLALVDKATAEIEKLN